MKRKLQEKFLRFAENFSKLNEILMTNAFNHF